MRISEEEIQKCGEVLVKTVPWKCEYFAETDKVDQIMMDTKEQRDTVLLTCTLLGCDGTYCYISNSRSDGKCQMTDINNMCGNYTPLWIDFSDIKKSVLKVFLQAVPDKWKNANRSLVDKVVQVLN